MPVTLVSDNGAQFCSNELKEFYLRSGVHNLTSAPYHPQSNGQAEKFVDTFKRALAKIRNNTTTLQEFLDIFLQTYRTTPNFQNPQHQPPTDVMFGRSI